MARSHLATPLWLLGVVAALGCGSGGGGAGGTGGTPTGSGGQGTSSSSSSGTGGGSSSSSSSSTSSSGAGGTGGMGTGGTGGAGTGGMGTGGSGGMGGSGGTTTTTSSTTTTSTIDPSTLDQDGDGWTPAQGDCCDVISANCQEPARVNPGAFEYPGNGVDDDCDASTNDSAPPPSCSATAMFASVGAEDLLRAMDLCQFTDEAPATPKDKRWGVINGASSLVLADGTTPLPAGSNVQTGVLTSYGPNVLPKKYATMAALSSGTARAPADPGYVHPQNGAAPGQTGNYNGMTQVPIQSTYLAPHGGKPPTSAQCAQSCVTGCDQAYDSVNLKTRIRVPTNARSFSYQFKFYSAEFSEYLCQKYNDFFVALLKSTWLPDPAANPPEQPLPLDTNIAFDALGNPVSVNNGFFQVCFPPFNAPPGTCPSGTLELIGNGMGGWGSALNDGGGTEWLTNTAPAVPGEIIELQFVMWDAGDHNVDSLVLLDHFRWSITPSPVGVHK